jgi:hypothetical protein
MTIQCPKCGAWIDSAATYCIRCHENLAEVNASNSIREKKIGIGERVGTAFVGMIVTWFLGWLFTVVIPWFPFYIVVGAGMLVFFAALFQPSKNLFVSECPYCGHGTEGAPPVFTCKHYKNKITVQNGEFQRLKTS